MSIGKEKLSEKAVHLFEESGSSYGKAQKLFLEAFRQGVEDMKKWHKDSEDAFNAARRLARPLCLKGGMEATTFSGKCSTVKKMLLFGLEDFTIGRHAVETLQEAKNECVKIKNADGTYGVEKLSYVDAMAKFVKDIDKQQIISNDKEEEYVNVRFPDISQYDDVEKFKNAILENIKWYLNHADNAVVLKGEDVQAKALRLIKNIAEENVAAQKAVA